MREIKFRAWDSRKMEMHYSGNFELLTFSTRTSCWVWNTVHHENNDPLYDAVASQNTPPDSLMQFTGLKDKNGKDIYEGDLLVIQNSLEESFEGGNPADIWEIEWSDLTYYLKHHDKYTHKGSECLSDWLSGGRVDGEIIGNIHQDSHLLDENP